MECLHSGAAQTRLSSNAPDRCRHPGSAHLSSAGHISPVEALDNNQRLEKYCQREMLAICISISDESFDTLTSLLQPAR